MSKTVWMTAKGDRYHAREDCRALVSGQQGSDVQGYEVQPVEQISEDEARLRGRIACLTCGSPI
ncbi:hypothetical protein [Streptomyces aurantiogriseus]|uniref:Uncharacterized protein n=1 Tax=Streptomyces aurantiogriseus TaxID=66870 RepID=A0A918CI97_9ACTN|nr:hypothetical protein [Streptomyces aurantiogriseus]GGR24118.1 hypothetical protein GCM10010251_45240 [Streptomyces aurantiogriseus]